VELAERLKKAKRPTPVPLTQERVEMIKQLLADGYSKKAIIKIFSIEYSDLKEIKK
jgi:hypothetical protein